LLSRTCENMLTNWITTLLIQSTPPIDVGQQRFEEEKKRERKR